MLVLTGGISMRVILGRAVAVLLAGAVLVLGWVLLASMLPSEKTVGQSMVTLDLRTLQTGRPEFFSVYGKKLIVFRPSEEQWDTLAAYRPGQSARDEPAFVQQLNAFVYWGHSSRAELCELHYLAPSRTRLSGFEPGTEWRGGYFDLACEISFDLAGRPINDYRLSYNGYVRDDARPLRTPKIRVSGHSITVIAF